MKVFVPDGRFHAELDPLPEGVVVTGDVAADAEVMVVGMEAAGRLPDLVRQLPNLRVIQSLNAGVEWIRPHVPAGVHVHSASGVHDIAVSEWVVAAWLALRRKFPEFLDLQRRGIWDLNANDTTATGVSSVGPIDDVHGATCVILGFGSIGRAVAARLAPFGVRTIGIARRAREDAMTSDALPELLAIADALVILVPLEASTDRLVNAALLARMKPGAVLINAARGRIVDTDALVEALNERRIQAALDVTDPEPLPAGHPLWSAPNVLITPHVAGAVSRWRIRAYRFAGDQVRRYAAGEPLLNRR